MQSKSKNSPPPTDVEAPDLAYVEQLLAAGDTPVSPEAAEPIATPTETVAATEVVHDDPVVLPAQCMLRDAVELKPMLLAHAAAPQLQIELSAVERVDAAFMQVLLALVLQRRQQGMESPHWLGGSAALEEAAKLLGLQTHLQMPAAA